MQRKLTEKFKKLEFTSFKYEHFVEFEGVHCFRNRPKVISINNKSIHKKLHDLTFDYEDMNPDFHAFIFELELKEENVYKMCQELKILFFKDIAFKHLPLVVEYKDEKTLIKIQATPYKTFMYYLNFANIEQ